MSTSSAHPYPTLHKTVQVDGLDIAYREAGPGAAPTLLLLHGFPTSSHMFRNLIPQLADAFHVVAPAPTTPRGKPIFASISRPP